MSGEGVNVLRSSRYVSFGRQTDVGDGRTRRAGPSRASLRVASRLVASCASRHVSSRIVSSRRVASRGIASRRVASYACVDRDPTPYVIRAAAAAATAAP